MIAAALLEQGAEVPEDLLPAEVWPVAEPYRAAFRVLSSARGSGFGVPLPLAYSEILAYARANGFAGSQSEVEEFVRLIQDQDAVFLEQCMKKLPKPGKQ